MAEKVTTMVLNVDLQCSRCYKKIKKVLCQIPQIRDQVYDEKANTVTIKVVCCSPEKIRQKLCCKAGGLIKSIDIKEPEKKKPPENKPADQKPQVEKPSPVPEKPAPPSKPADQPQPASKPPAPNPVPGYPPFYPIGVVGVWGRGWRCYDGCDCGCGGSRRPPPCHVGCDCGCGGSRRPPPCHVGCGCGCGGTRVDANRCVQYFFEENPPACTIM